MASAVFFTQAKSDAPELVFSTTGAASYVTTAEESKEPYNCLFGDHDELDRQRDANDRSLDSKHYQFWRLTRAYAIA